MHTDLSISDEQLRLATTRRLPHDVPLDAETAALRERFLALGNQLEARAADFDEQALVLCLRAAPPAAAAAAAGRPDALPRRPVVLPALVAAALAASALVAIVRIAEHRPGGGAPAGGVAATAPGLAPPAAPVLSAAIGRWEDPLDYEIASAQSELERLQGRKRTLDASLWDMNDQLRGLSSELESDSL